MLSDINFNSINTIDGKKIVNDEHIIIDSKSGVSGAGKKLKANIYLVR